MDRTSNREIDERRTKRRKPETRTFSWHLFFSPLSNRTNEMNAAVGLRAYLILLRVRTKLKRRFMHRLSLMFGRHPSFSVPSASQELGLGSMRGYLLTAQGLPISLWDIADRLRMDVMSSGAPPPMWDEYDPASVYREMDGLEQGFWHVPVEDAEQDFQDMQSRVRMRMRVDSIRRSSSCTPSEVLTHFNCVFFSTVRDNLQDDRPAFRGNVARRKHSSPCVHQHHLDDQGCRTTILTISGIVQPDFHRSHSFYIRVQI
jgi:hypothetical protein